MLALQLQLPPLPQFITVGHSIWQPGDIHFERNFPVFDVLFINKGKLHLTEDAIPYDLDAGSILVLEPGKTHMGHRPCEVNTEIYWLHFIQPTPVITINSKQISWTTIINKGTDFDFAPVEQVMFLPKLIKTDLKQFVPTLQSMVALHQKSNLMSALSINALFAQLLTLLQSSLIEMSTPTRSAIHSKKMELILKENLLHPYKMQQIEEKLQLNFDYLARCLKKHTGMSPMQYIQYQRIERAKTLLTQSNHNISYIAEEVGILDYNYFIRLFRKQVGVTPGVYRLNKHKKL
ncbi:helix-turn-helix transcriptional regulator [Paenibacillus roseipurpureus]|uniref:AraC family transcriptional regulator n=1 Tax=Paenibacillus roseopurpureus TaxID=2918901 RepID=A0AA96LSU9_9BACL|nr:AraC family transcriptional regulator [Paenibacillus sp. MBLB1832]WNR45298.1 AraC family transcriptional regulator [Paenibacillus sp. MBLB1832]